MWFLLRYHNGVIGLPGGGGPPVAVCVTAGRLVCSHRHIVIAGRQPFLAARPHDIRAIFFNAGIRRRATRFRLERNRASGYYLPVEFYTPVTLES